MGRILSRTTTYIFRSIGFIFGCLGQHYGTYREKVCRLWIEDRKIAENLRDSRRENKLITGRHILIDIYKGEYEVRGKIYSESLKKG